MRSPLQQPLGGKVCRVPPAQRGASPEPHCSRRWDPPSLCSRWDSQQPGRPCRPPGTAERLTNKSCFFFFLATPCACGILVPAASSLRCSWPTLPAQLPTPAPASPHTTYTAALSPLASAAAPARGLCTLVPAIRTALGKPPPPPHRLISPHSSFVSELPNYVRASVTFIRLPDRTDWRSQQELRGINQKALQQH